jgi:cytidine deaminase
VHDPPPQGVQNGAMAETTVDSQARGTTAFDCPRCGATVDSDFYGPCGQCRQVLRATIAADARQVESAGYEPKMNVTPNAVATKD